MTDAKHHLSSLYGAIHQRYDTWQPGDRPALNTWYPCKRGDDYYKIIVGRRGSYNNDRRTWDTRPTYRVVSMRGADIGFDLTLAMARTMICTETRRA